MISWGAHETNLRGHELWRPAKRARRISIPHLHFTQPIVAYFNMTVQSQEDVIQLEIPVHNSIVVEVLQRQADFCRIELSASRRELLALDVQEKIAATYILHHEIDTRLGLEAGMQID